MYFKGEMIKIRDLVVTSILRPHFSVFYFFVCRPGINYTVV